jgi:hypothetical protein
MKKMRKKSLELRRLTIRVLARASGRGGNLYDQQLEDPLGNTGGADPTDSDTGRPGQHVSNNVC